MKFLMPIIVIIAIIGGYLALKQNSNQTYKPPAVASPSPKQSLKTFESKTMNFKVELPSKYNVEEKFTTVNFKVEKGEIIVSRNGTNFKSLDEYLSDLRTKNKLEVREEKKLIIDNNDVVVLFVKITGNDNDTKEYFIYVDNWVYLINSREPSLYPDLDQIAQSFRYTP